MFSAGSRKTSNFNCRTFLDVPSKDKRNQTTVMHCTFKMLHKGRWMFNIQQFILIEKVNFYCQFRSMLASFCYPFVFPVIVASIEHLCSSLPGQDFFLLSMYATKLHERFYTAAHMSQGEMSPLGYECFGLKHVSFESQWRKFFRWSYILMEFEAEGETK